MDRIISAGPEPRSYRVSVSSGETRRIIDIIMSH